MAWWLAPSIVGVILAGIVIGLLVSIVIIKIQKRKSPLPVKDDFMVTQDSRPLATVTPRYSEPVAKPTNPVISSQDRLDEYLLHPKNTAVDTPKKSEALMELEINLAIASKPITDKLVNFRVNVWNTRRAEFNVINRELVGELTEAYVDMLLANNLVWLGTELGRDSPDLTSGYLKLSNKIAERLTRIMPSVRDAFSKA